MLGGLTLFVWGAVSHMVLPLYNNALHKFTNQDAVTQVVAANTPFPGTYFLPNYPNYPEGATEEDKKMLDEKMEQQMVNGPMVFAHVRVGAMESMGTLMVTEFLTNTLAALVATVLLVSAMQLTFGKRVLFAVGIALVMLFDHSASTWNWYSAGLDFFFAEVVDAVLGWALAGMVIAKVLGKGEMAEARVS